MLPDNWLNPFDSSVLADSGVSCWRFLPLYQKEQMAETLAKVLKTFSLPRQGGGDLFGLLQEPRLIVNSVGHLFFKVFA